MVVHNKLKPKKAKLPDDVRYYAGAELGDIWVEYRAYTIHQVFSCLSIIPSSVYLTCSTRPALAKYTDGTPFSSSQHGNRQISMSTIDYMPSKGREP